MHPSRVQSFDVTNLDHSEGGRVTKHMSRRQRKKAAKEQPERPQSNGALKHANAALRKSRARRLHQIMRRPGGGGLTAQGANQLRRYLSKKVPDTEKLSIREMDESAKMIMLQMAAEEVDVEGPSYGELKQVTEKMMVNGANERKGGDEKDKKVEETVQTEDVIDEAERELGDEDWKEGGVSPANVITLCIRSKD